MVGFRFQSPGVAVSPRGSLKHITSSPGPEAEVRCWMRGMVCVLR